jgi:glycosyltransferase involved in cell wall biosynthesis
MPRLPLSVIHDAIDTDVFCPVGPVSDLDALAQSDPAPTGTVRIGLIATYARWKGHDVFLQAARLVKARLSIPAIQFYVIGGPIYDTAGSEYSQEELHELAARLSSESCVRFVPFQERIEEVYRALDIVVHASTRREPFGRTIAEAMATGRAVVASKKSGAAELCVDAVDAVCIAIGNTDALADALCTLITDGPRRRGLGAAARSAAVDRFSRARLAKQVLTVYRGAGCMVDGLLAERGGHDVQRPG